MADTRSQNDDGGGGAGAGDPTIAAGEDSVDLVQESSTLRWEGHRTQGANIALGLRFDHTVRTLERRGNDREAREVLLRLAKELRQFNETIAGRLLRMSAINRTVVEVLRKSEDGKAALMMRKAAELLVKGLANAEEEIHSLKATITEVEAQRDHYKAVLAKTNSELETSLAYAQVSKAIGEQAGRTAAAAASSAAAAAASPSVTASAAASSAGDDPVRRRPTNRGGGAGGGGGTRKGKGPARRPQEEQEGPGGVAHATSISGSAAGRSGGGSDSDTVAAADPPVIADAAAAFKAAFAAAGVGGSKGDESGGDGEGRGRAAPPASHEAGSKKRRRPETSAPSLAGGSSSGGDGAGRDRGRTGSFGVADSGEGGNAGEGRLHGRREKDSVRHDQNYHEEDKDGPSSEEGEGRRRRRRRRREDGRKGKTSSGGSSSSGGGGSGDGGGTGGSAEGGEWAMTGASDSNKQRGVEVPTVTTVNDGWMGPLGSGGSRVGGGDRTGTREEGSDIDRSDGGDGGDRQGDDLQSACDSDDAPSMFF